MKEYALLMLIMLVVSLLAWTPARALAVDKQPSSIPAPALANSASFIDVTQADGRFVKEPIVSATSYNAKIAAQNTTRMKAIMNSGLIGEYCRIHFPAGSYYFNGAAPGWEASIQTTAKNQSITGDGINATRIIQKSLTVPSTVMVGHSNGTIENLSIMSVDRQAKLNPVWEDHPHQSAIVLDAASPWYTDPQIKNVNINATGNNIIVDGYYRPFKIGIEIRGPWLNIYVHTMFILHVHNAIYINQGRACGGPAKFIDVNAYAVAPNSEEPKPKVWNVFFKSEGNFMEQVELIHCTYIGSQFISMDGTKQMVDKGGSNQPTTTPVYNMIVDHCYINSLWLPTPSDDPKWSGIYMNLPPKPGGIDAGFGYQLHSRRILFTNNTCLGKSPGDGAFFYVEGNIRDLTIQGNSIESGGGKRAIYIRATTPFIDTDVAVRDVSIMDNMIQDFAYPIVIGGEADSSFVEGVHIAGNRTTYIKSIDTNQAMGVTLSRVRRLNMNGNRFAPTRSSSVLMNRCEDITMSANQFTGMETGGSQGISLLHCKTASIANNIILRYKLGVGVQGCEDMVLSGNNIALCPTGMELKDSRGMMVTGNVISGSDQPISTNTLTEAVIESNIIRMASPDTKPVGDAESSTTR